MAKTTRKTTKKTTSEKPDFIEPIKKVIIPYIETITKDTPACDVVAKKLPNPLMLVYKQSPEGNRSLTWRGKTGVIYTFAGGTPTAITNDLDRAFLVWKARKNPETWEIVN